MFLIREMPKDERPRERLVAYGVKALSNVELIAILLRTGNKNKSVLNLAKDVSYHLDKIQDLQNATPEELSLIPGIKEAKAATILAAIELGRRVYLSDFKENFQISSTYDVYEMMKFLNMKEQEHFYCIYLDTKIRVIKKERIYKGTVDQMVIHPREVFRQAIKYNSSHVIFVHNHPTGDAKPSRADNETTKVLEQATKYLHITMLDHVIIGKNQFYSYKEDKTYYD